MAKKEKEKEAPKENVNSKLLEQLSKRLGLEEGELKTGSDHVSITDVFSTGNAELDSIITPGYYEKHGVGGVPRGFLCEFFGPNAGGKSSLCMKIAAIITKHKKGKVLWVDAENSFMEDWAASHGIDMDNLIMCPFRTTGEQYLKIITEAAGSGAFQLIVVDSLEALTPKALVEGDLEENAKIGAKALMMSRACPFILQAAKKGNCTVIFINQIRSKITMYGDPETTPGGEALKYYASLRLRISQVSSKTRGILCDGEEIGIRSNVLVKKSRFGPPYRETVLSIYYGGKKPHPIDDLLDLAMSNKLVKSRTKKVKGDKKYSETEDLQVFSLSIVDENEKLVPGIEHLQKVDGFDEFKDLLTPTDLELIYNTLKTMKVPMNPEIGFFIEERKKDDVDMGGGSPTDDIPIE